MTLSIIWVLIPAGIFLIILLVMSVSHVILVWRFCQHSFLASFSSGIFLIGIGLIVVGAFFLLREVDWSQSFELSFPTFGITATTPSL